MTETTKQRVIAIIRLVIPCVVSIAAMYGVQIDADMLVQAALTIFAGVAWVLAWWKDNNITKAAIERHSDTEGE